MFGKKEIGSIALGLTAGILAVSAIFLDTGGTGTIPQTTTYAQTKAEKAYVPQGKLDEYFICWLPGGIPASSSYTGCLR